MLQRILLFIFVFGFFGNLFSQNTLGYYIDKAKNNSPLLQNQENNNKIIDLDLQQYRAIYKSPQVNVNSLVMFAPIVNVANNKSSFQLTSSGSNDYYGYDLGATNGGLFQALVSVNQSLNGAKFYQVQQEKSNIAKEQNQYSSQLTKAELEQVVTHQYIICVQTQKLIENSNITNQMLLKQKLVLDELVKAGVYRLIDLKLLEIEFSSNNIEIESLRAQYYSNFNALRLTCGIEDTSVVILQNADLQINSPVNNTSLFATKYRMDSLSIVAEQKMFNLKYLPQFDAFADAGLNATYLPTPNRLGFSVGVSLKWNLYDGHQQHIIDEKSKIQLQNIENEKSYFEIQNSITKNNILQQINSLDKQIKSINNQLTEYDKLLELYDLEIRKGLVSILEIKSIIKEISLKNQEITNLNAEKEILINTYNYWNR